MHCLIDDKNLVKEQGLQGSISCDDHSSCTIKPKSLSRISIISSTAREVGVIP